MRINEVKETIERVVRVEYVAEDGTVFYNKTECEKYEESALCIVKAKLKKINKKWLSQDDVFNDSYYDCEVEFFNVQTERDLDNLKQYIILVLKKNECYDKLFEEAIEQFDCLTYGHEIVIAWNEDKSYFVTRGDGSIEAHTNYLKERMMKCIINIDEE